MTGEHVSLNFMEVTGNESDFSSFCLFLSGGGGDGAELEMKARHKTGFWNPTENQGLFVN